MLRSVWGVRSTSFLEAAQTDEPRHRELHGLEASVETLPARSALKPWEMLFGEQAPLQLFLEIERLMKKAPSGQGARFSALVNEALHLVRRTRELEIQHIHTHFATDAAISAMMVFALGGPSYSLTVHAKDIYRAGVDRELLRHLISTAKFVVTVCDANVGYLREQLGATAIAKVRRLYNGVDLESFSESWRVGEREPAHILSVGRLVRKKGFDIFLRALATLRRQGRSFRASVVGDGEERAALQKLILDLELSDRVQMLGALTQDQIRILMRRATLFCLPCVVAPDGNRDALPTVLLESLASGLPTISTPVTGIPEILDEGRAGLLVPCGDVRRTAQAIDELLSHPEKRRQLAEAGVRRARTLFDLRQSSRTLFGWFEEVLRAQEVVVP